MKYLYILFFLLIYFQFQFQEKIYQEMTAAFGESELEDLYNKLDALEKKLGNREAT